jgi:hypothetical protein
MSRYDEFLLADKRSWRKHFFVSESFRMVSVPAERCRPHLVRLSLLGGAWTGVDCGNISSWSSLLDARG